MSEISLSYSYQTKDYKNFNKETFSIKRILISMFKNNLIVITSTSLFIAIILTFSFYGGIFFKSLMFYFHLLLLFIFLFIVYYGLALGTAFLSGGRAICWQQQGIDPNVILTVKNDIIEEDHGNIKTTYKWNSVVDIYEKKYNFLIFISDYKAIIVPKRIFVSNDEKNKFWEHLQHCYNEAKKHC